MIARLLAALALALACAPAFAQARSDAELRAYLSSGVARLGDRVALIVAVENARTAEIRPLPKVSGLTIGPIGEPSEKYFIQTVNGRTTRSVSRTWVIPLTPADVGQYLIPNFEVLVDGEARKTSELQLNVVKDMKGEELGFFELASSSNKVIVGQPFSIELVFGFDAALREKSGYYNLALAWWGRLPGLLENDVPVPPQSTQKGEILLNGRDRLPIEILPERQLRGRPFVTLRVQRSFTPTRSGTMEIPTSFFEFGEVIRSPGLFNDRWEKGETFFARAGELAIEVVPLPEEGRPLEYGGAIGKLEVRASAEPRDVDAGDSIKLKLEWTGAGNLEFFTAPDPARLDAFRDFRVYGKTEQKAFDRRTVVYDLAATTSQLKAIPPLPLSVYDPEAERYVVVASDAIPIRVRALEGAAALSNENDAERFAKDIRDIVLRPVAREEPRPLGVGVVLGALAALPVGWIALRAFARRRFDPDAPAERARRKARKQLARDLARAAGREETTKRVALADWMLREGLAQEALAELDGVLVASPDEPSAVALLAAPPQSLNVAGLGALDRAIEALEATVWGGGRAGVSKDELLRAADEALRGGL